MRPVSRSTERRSHLDGAVDGVGPTGRGGHGELGRGERGRRQGAVHIKPPVAYEVFLGE